MVYELVEQTGIYYVITKLGHFFLLKKIKILRDKVLV